MKQITILFSNFLFLFMVVTLFFSNVKSDIPVHCLVEQTHGEWIFKIHSDIFNASLKDPRTHCGHGFPNKVVNTVGDTDNFPDDNYKEINLKMSDDYNVYENGNKVGNWTPVYDEGFILYYKNAIMTAHYKYYKPSASAAHVSNCAKTSIGWYMPDKNNKTKNWSCFHAYKKANANFLEKNSNSFHSFITLKTKVQTQTKLHSEFKYEHMAGLVDQINKANLSWKANVHQEFVGYSFLELKNKLGLKRNSHQHLQFNTNQKSPMFLQIESEKKVNVEDMDLKGFLEKINKVEAKIQSYGTEKETTKSKVHTNSNGIINNADIKPENPSNNNQIRDKDSVDVDQDDWDEILKYHDKKPEEIEENKLPKNWDWRNVGGMSLLPSVYRQGGCGSCYIFSAVTSLEGRLRVLTKNQDKTIFSKQFPISCGFYTEGCDGGYPILVGKFFSEFEIVPEECFKYQQSDVECSKVCDYTKYKKKYTVSNYGYLGGHYGNTSEADMIKELRARGPMPGNILVPSSFSYYSNGIFSTSGIHSENITSKLTLIDKHLTWEKVEHSITLVGYGESEDGEKYWIGMNTWGEDWGEKGFFKLKRGNNELSVESMGDFLHIKVEDR